MNINYREQRKEVTELERKKFEPDDNKIYEAFRKAVVRLRSKHHLTQATVAGKLGVSFTTYSHYETGDRKITVGMLYKIAAVLGVPVTDLLGDASKSHMTPKESYIIDQYRLLDERGRETVESCMQHEYERHGKKEQE